MRVRVRVRIGKKGALLDRTLVVKQRASGFARGEVLGCGADPTTAVAYGGVTGLPEFEPDRVFYSANAGPYVRDLTWTGWGTARVVGRRTSISDCASCGPKERLAAQIVLTKPKASADGSGKFYTAQCLRKRRGGRFIGRDVSTRKAC